MNRSIDLTQTNVHRQPRRSKQAKNTPAYILYLASSRKGRVAGRSVEEIDLGLASSNKAGQDLAAALVPLRKLIGSHSAGILAIVEALDQRRRSSVTATDIEGPADEGTVLVGVESDGFGSVGGDAVLGNLSIHSQRLILHFVHPIARLQWILTARSEARSFLPSSSDRGMGYGTSEQPGCLQRWPYPTVGLPVGSLSALLLDTCMVNAA